MTYLITDYCTIKNYICEVLRGVIKIEGLTEYRKISLQRKKITVIFYFTLQELRITRRLLKVLRTMSALKRYVIHCMK